MEIAKNEVELADSHLCHCIEGTYTLTIKFHTPNSTSNNIMGVAKITTICYAWQFQKLPYMNILLISCGHTVQGTMHCSKCAYVVAKCASSFLNVDALDCISCVGDSYTSTYSMRVKPEGCMYLWLGTSI